LEDDHVGECLHQLHTLRFHDTSKSILCEDQDAINSGGTQTLSLGRKLKNVGNRQTFLNAWGDNLESLFLLFLECNEFYFDDRDDIQFQTIVPPQQAGQRIFFDLNDSGFQLVLDLLMPSRVVRIIVREGHILIPDM
jgi:hypothetical protein